MDIDLTTMDVNQIASLLGDLTGEYMKSFNIRDHQRMAELRGSILALQVELEMRLRLQNEKRERNS